MGCYDLQLVVYDHTTHPVSSSRDHSQQFQILYGLLVQDTTLLHRFLSDTHHFPSLDTTHFQIVFVLPCSPVPMKLQLLKLVKQFGLGMESINAGKNPHSIFALWPNCVFYILIVMPFFSSYAFSSLSTCDSVKAITSSPYRSEYLERIVIDLLLDSNAFLILYIRTI